MANAPTLETLLKQIDEAQKTIDTPLQALKPAVRASFEMAVAEAKREILQLRKDYSKLLFGVTSVYCPYGDATKAKQFSDLAAVQGQALTLDSNSLYRNLAEFVESTIGRSREFGSSQIVCLYRALQDAFTGLGYPHATFNRPVLREIGSVPTVEDTVALIRNLTETAIGITLNMMVLEKNIVEAAIGSGFAGKVLRIVAHNTTPEERMALAASFRRVTPVDLDAAKEIDEAFVISTFKGQKSPK